MSAQGLEVIEQTAQITHEWINELAARLGYGSKRTTLRLLRATLRALRDRLPPDELAQFSAQLPLLVRGMLFEGWDPNRTPDRSLDLVEAVNADMANAAEFAGSEDVGYVFDLLNNRISRGEIEDVRACLSEHTRTIWKDP